MNSKAREAADEIDACLARVLSAPEYLKAPGISELATIISRHFPPTEATQVAKDCADLAAANRWALSEIERLTTELTEARADAIRDAIAGIEKFFNGLTSMQVNKDELIAALTKKEGDDGPMQTADGSHGNLSD
jgi:hypothetical protein